MWGVRQRLPCLDRKARQRPVTLALSALPAVIVRGLRAFARRDAERLRHVGVGTFVLPAFNPGVRIEPAFVSDEEAAALVAEAREAARLYGYDYDGDKRAYMVNPADGAIEEMAQWVNNTRVTGRLEKPGGVQTLPPWGYGSTFDEAQLPPCMSALATKIRGFRGYDDVGRLQDVTLNLRYHSFFQLDPHLDPRKPSPPDLEHLKPPESHPRCPCPAYMTTTAPHGSYTARVSSIANQAN